MPLYFSMRIRITCTGTAHMKYSVWMEDATWKASIEHRKPPLQPQYNLLTLRVGAVQQNATLLVATLAGGLGAPPVRVVRCQPLAVASAKLGLRSPTPPSAPFE